MKEALGLYKSIVESSSYAYVVVDYTGKIVFANKTFTTISKYSPKELLLDIKLGEVALGEEIVSHIIIAARKERPLKGLKSTIMPKSGPQVPVSLSASLMKEHMKVLFSFRDLRLDKDNIKEINEFRQVVASRLWIGLFEWGIEGPTSKVTEISPFFSTKTKPEDIVEEMAAYFSLNLPQNKETEKNFGLYGFLPIPRVIDYVALIYTFKIASKNIDPRFDGVGYAFLVIAVPKTLERFFTNKSSISKTIERNLKDITVITDIDFDTIVRIKNEIIDVEMS